ncbi:hypothetical protein Salat_2630200 [Sesamum alatum]|uniref:RNase H type-1 domain-containing protein n=1 Tax=Sesamum alatum TaxID=300844 RepID=A0AAE1XPH9_9LAMI|nr:hypothetical protein Salat_2630200 [Sesamum alatum]
MLGLVTPGVGCCRQCKGGRRELKLKWGPYGRKASTALRDARGSEEEPPAAGVVKINFDGAVFADGWEGGSGVVARSLEGECIAWASHRYVKPVFPELVEAIAVREAALLAIPFGWPRVCIEGDCAPRDGNRVAHSLARSDGAFTVGTSLVPQTIVQCLVSDLEAL